MLIALSVVFILSSNDPKVVMESILFIQTQLFVYSVSIYLIGMSAIGTYANCSFEAHRYITRPPLYYSMCINYY